MDVERKHKTPRSVWVREPYTQIETKVSHNGTQVLVITGRDGWNYKSYDNRDPERTWYQSSRGKHVRISMNGPLKFTEDEWEEFKAAVDESLREAKEL